MIEYSSDCLYPVIRHSDDSLGMVCNIYILGGFYNDHEREEDRAY